LIATIMVGGEIGTPHTQSRPRFRQFQLGGKASNSRAQTDTNSRPNELEQIGFRNRQWKALRDRVELERVDGVIIIRMFVPTGRRLGSD
jgi:hypothetical protein